MAPQPSSLRTSFRALFITRIEIKESVIYTARESPGAATYGWAHDPRITDSMLKLTMGHSQSSNMGKTYYNVSEGSIGSVVGEKG
jgi:hypothetical protein